MKRLWIFLCTIYYLVGGGVSTFGQTLPDLVFVQIPVQEISEVEDEIRTYSFTDRYIDGSQILLLRSSNSKAINLTSGFTAAVDPDISFDAKTIVFSGKKSSQDHWQIWRMDADGSNKKQITKSNRDCFSPVHAGTRFYLNDPQPTPQIIYVGAEHGWQNQDGRGPAFALYGTDPDGESTHRLTFNLNNDFSPDILPNGRIVFTSHQVYGDRYSPTGLFALMAVNNDGTDLMPFYGNHEKPIHKDMVHVADFGDRIYFIESNDPKRLGGGDIAYVSQRRPLNSYQKLTQENKGLFHSPCPLLEGGLVASYRKISPGSAFGLYQIDAKSGKRKKRLFAEKGMHAIDAQALIPHPTVKGRSNWLIPGAKTGVFYCLDTYRTNMPDGKNISPGQIKYVRVIEGIPFKENLPESQYQNEIQINHSTPFAPQRILGVAPVEKDGSFHIRVPAEIPITFQLLDENYMAIRTQKAWTWVMGNENRGCIGCHENRELSPPNKMVQAITRPADDLTAPAEQRTVVDFQYKIAPIVQKKCAVAGCHVNGHSLPNLQEISNSKFSQSYLALLKPRQNQKSGNYIIPGNAKQSPLIHNLFGGKMADPKMRNHEKITQKRILTAEERQLFVEWIDLGAQWDVRSSIINDPSAAGKK